ncbi:MAG: phosphoribosylamine--glycine ligase [Methanomassiliicoccales archaeon PtaU1.Bin124]|nr:MAG: phosphoribosylamine--glycine ligase [Methanomassiliicoccales archaeon PtaU1.Bin124]
MKEKVLVVGGGGREHAIVAALQRAEAKVYAAMKNRNPGIARAAVEFAQVSETDVDKVVAFAVKAGVELAVIGPESPLEVGLADALRGKGIGCVGPSKAAARLETSKSFARELMDRHRIAGNLRFASFNDAKEAKDHIDDIDYQVAVKPVGLTGGKGVKVEGEHLITKADVKAYIDEIFQHKIGGAGVVLEERAEGEEFTLQVFCDGKDIVTMPLVQDHKRAYEGDVGPNTGGMGSYTDANHLLPFVRSGDKEEATRILKGVVGGLRTDGHPYQGIIYGQFMLTKDGPKVIEFNARFGDPEAMNVLTLFDGNFTEAAWGVAIGNVSRSKVSFKRKATVCKYVVPEGYGTVSKAGLPITVDEKAIAEMGAACYYAAVNEEEGKIFTGTSRSVGVVGLGDSIDAAETMCEAALKHVKGEALFVRHDIGRKELVQRRVDHMKQVRGD